jgi:hypothetical protein
VAPRSRQEETGSFRELPFSELIKRDRRLAELRREYARRGLLKLPTDTPEIEVIIDKADDYLLSEKDFERAADLHAAASTILPTSTPILGSLIPNDET